jgi:predicted GIY-YIG superfamily endonuclease
MLQRASDITVENCVKYDSDRICAIVTPADASSHTCYVLESRDGRLTYVGYTNSILRRIRQHNGIISGGAKYTSRCRPWNVLAIVCGFQTKTQGLQFEYAMKHVREARHCRGVTRRRRALETLLWKDRWTSKSCDSCTVPLRVYVFDERISPPEAKVPPHVRIVREIPCPT